MNTQLREEIKEMLETELPLIDFNSDHLYQQLDSLSTTYIIQLLTDKYGVRIELPQISPRTFSSVDSITELVEKCRKQN